MTAVLTAVPSLPGETGEISLAPPPVWRPGMRYPYRQWSRWERREEARTRAAEWRRFGRMTDLELRAQVMSLVDTSRFIWQDRARLRCAVSVANRRGVTAGAKVSA
jgi:hypothetical protein